MKNGKITKKFVAAFLTLAITVSMVAVAGITSNAAPYVPKTVNLVKTGMRTETPLIGIYAFPEGTVFYVGDKIKIPDRSTDIVCTLHTGAVHKALLGYVTDGSYAYQAGKQQFAANGGTYTCKAAGTITLKVVSLIYENSECAYHSGSIGFNLVTFTILPAPVDPDQTAADVVIAQIAALNTVVTIDDEAAIVAAREAYTALTPAQQALVTNLTKLTDAEAALDLIKNPPIAQDKTELGNAILQAQAILADGKTYSASSLSYLNGKLALAQKKFNSNATLQTSADTALVGLNSAIAAMVDITEYNDVKLIADGILADIGYYTPDSASYLQRKYDLITAMVDSTPNARQARIDSAVAILNNAIGQIVNQSAYNTTKEQAEALLADSASYTDGTVSYLQRKYNLAYAMVDGTHAPKADRIASAIAILNNGMGALKAK